MGKQKKQRVLFISILLVILLFAILAVLFYRINWIPHKKYTNEHFGIESYKSTFDCDGDGVDDQTDILESAYAYIETKPKYKSKYYEGGYPNDQYGVCTDVVAQALLGAGYDLQKLVDADIEKNKEDYPIEEADSNIDFRRVKNLRVFFEHNAKSLTCDVHEIDEWQGGDIVVFTNHIGIVSSNRNKNGVAFVIHHANPYQIFYEEDILEQRKNIVGHYRLN